MPNGKNPQLTLALAEYERLGEPDQAEKSQAWQTAIGLQQVDGLATSKYLLETAKSILRDGSTSTRLKPESTRITRPRKQDKIRTQPTRGRQISLRLALLNYWAKPPSISQPLLTSIFIKSSSQAFIHTPERFAPTTSRKKNGY